MVKVTLTILFALLATAVGRDVPRISGLFPSFQDQQLNGDNVDSVIREGTIGSLPVPETLLWPNVAGSRLRFFGQDYNQLLVIGGGQIFIKNANTVNPNPFNPNQDNLLGVSVNRFVSALHITAPDTDLQVSFALRGLDCDSQPYRKSDCTRIAGEINRINNIDPYGTNALRTTVATIITFRYRVFNPINNDIITTVYAQTVIANLIPKNVNVNAINPNLISTQVLFVYDPLPSNIGLFDPSRAILNAGNGINIQICTLPIDFPFDQSNQLCGKPGMYYFDVTNAPVINNGNPNICTPIVDPHDTCTETVWCVRNPLTGTDEVDMFIFFQNVEPNVPGGVHIRATDAAGNPNLNPTCTRRLTTDSFVTYSYSIISNPCGLEYRPNSPLIDTDDELVGYFIRQDEVGFRQHNDYELTATCNVRDLDIDPFSFTVGDVMNQVVSRTMDMSFTIVDRTGPGAVPFPNRACRVGEMIVLEMSFTPDINGRYIEGIDPFGISPVTCSISNNVNFVNDANVLVQVFDEFGNPRGLTTPAESVDFIVNGCANPNLSDRAFEILTSRISENPLDGFIRIDNAVRGQPWRIQAGPMKCASFKNTQAVYIRCDIDFCGGPFVQSDAFCLDSCQSNNRKRRQANGTDDEPHYVRSRFLVTPEGGNQEQEQEKEEVTSTCVDSSVAIATLVGLVVALVLASALTVGALVKTMIRRKSSSSTLSSYSS